MCFSDLGHCKGDSPMKGCKVRLLDKLESKQVVVWKVDCVRTNESFSALQYTAVPWLQVKLKFICCEFLVASACVHSVHQISWDLISSVVSGPLVLTDFVPLQLARNLAIQAQTRKVFHRLRFSNISVNTSFFGTATARISLAILDSTRARPELQY